MLAVWDQTPAFDREEVANLLGPLNTSPSGCVVPIISSPKQAWINEYRYVMYWCKLYSVLDRQEQKRVSSRSPRIF